MPKTIECKPTVIIGERRSYAMYFVGHKFRDIYTDGFEEFIDLVVPTVEGGLMKMMFQYRGYAPCGYHFIGMAEYDTQLRGTKKDHRVIEPREAVRLQRDVEWDWSNVNQDQKTRIHSRRKKQRN